jgi:hypothetical protein
MRLNLVQASSRSEAACCSAPQGPRAQRRQLPQVRTTTAHAAGSRPRAPSRAACRENLGQLEVLGCGRERRLACRAGGNDAGDQADPSDAGDPVWNEFILGMGSSGAEPERPVDAGEHSPRGAAAACTSVCVACAPPPQPSPSVSDALCPVRCRADRVTAAQLPEVFKMGSWRLREVVCPEIAALVAQVENCWRELLKEDLSLCDLPKVQATSLPPPRGPLAVCPLTHYAAAPRPDH